MLFFRMAVNMLQTSAWQVTSHFSSKSTMHVILSPSWIMKFISKSNCPPTSFREKNQRKTHWRHYFFQQHYNFFLNFRSQ
jgi:hypothetical protein